MENGKLPKSWEVKKLGEVCEFFNGKAHEKQIDKNGKYIVVNSKFISSNGKVLKKTNTQLFPLSKDDIVFVMSDVPNGKALAKCFLITENNIYTLNQRIGLIRSKIFDVKYLFYHLNRHRYLLSFDNGENQTNLRKKDILNCPLIIPPLSEQKKIVSILDKIFEAIKKAKANAEQNLQNAKELFQSKLQEIFENGEWEEKKLGEVCDLQNGFAFKSKSYIKHSNTLNIRMSNIRPDGSFNPDYNMKYLPDDFAESYKDFLLKEGDLIIAMTDMADNPKILGLPTMVKDLKGRNFLLNQRVGKLINFSDKVLVLFLSYYLRTPKIKNYYKSKGNGGLQLNISKKIVLEINIPIPPLSEQKKIVKILEELEIKTKRLEEIYQKKIEYLEELEKSILERAFNGELTKGMRNE